MLAGKMVEENEQEHGHNNSSAADADVAIKVRIYVSTCDCLSRIDHDDFSRTLTVTAFVFYLD